MKISACRICDSENVKKIVDLGYHPLADTFLPPHILFSHGEVSYPLQLGLCRDCGHVFTLFAVPPEDRYQIKDYSYDSSNSNVSVQHFRDFAEAVLAEKMSDPNGLVVDIGSNVGTLLAHFQSFGYQNVIGVEPSGNISELAIKAGVPTINDFFCDRVIKTLRGAGPVEVLLSANVLNHADDLGALLDTAKEVLAHNGILVFEVPYLLDLVQTTAFDTIYHEHVHYHAVQPLAAALARKGFSVFKIDRIDYMCGSIRVFTRVGGGHCEAVEKMIEAERDFGLFDPATWEAFMTRVRTVKTTVLSDLYEIRAKGGKIIAIGAATKGNTFINYCKLDSDMIEYVTDTSPLKIGKLTPGSHIPIIADEDIDASATHALILPWNIAPMLVSKLDHLGLEFYIPQVQILQKTN
jgi:SAM-dependent methyltransferase